MQLPLERPLTRPSRLRRFGGWLMSRISATLSRDTRFWRVSVIGVWAAYTIALILTVLGTPSGLGIVFDCFTAAFLGTLAMGLVSVTAAFVLSLAYIPLPRFFVSSVLYTGVIAYIILYHADMGVFVSIICSIIVAASGALTGCIGSALAHPRVRSAAKIAIVASIILIGVSLTIRLAPDDMNAVPAMGMPDAVSPAAVEAENPAQAGPYHVTAFTYGSGNDRHREEYGDDVTLQSASVDASAYITQWSRIREWFWGFDEKELPVNGRVWMPAGEGPFPVVLIVHGNHLMEQFSDGGYEYLGKLLASRGFVTVSVDENFLNYSVWGGIPNNDFKVRAWMLLKHLQQLAVFNEEPGNPLSGKMNLNEVALMGHSRGGQAAPMAADWTRFFKSDETLASLRDIHIQAVVAIAPTDKQIDDTSAQLRDIDYLTLQGALDGDVNDFYGERQYIRTTFTASGQSKDRFKASIYIGEANHSRFNTAWGAMDDSMPGGLFLRRADMMEAEDQREAAKVYIAAFLESALHGKQEYNALFQDYRSGLAWLPEATYYNRYESAAFLPLATFDEDRDKTKLRGGSTAEADGLQWTEEEATDRQRHNRGTRGIVLKWDSDRGGSYTIQLSDLFRNQLTARKPEALMFSLTDLERDLRKTGEQIPALDIEIELTMKDGSSVMYPLSRFMPVTPQMKSQFTIASWMEERIKDGKYEESTEPVFQTYTLPLQHFDIGGQPIRITDLTAISFRFQGGPGKVMLDDIGFE